MLGKSHALSGGVGWLVGCAGLTALGAAPEPATVLFGAAVSTGFALLPDVDHPQSTVAHSLGWLTRGIATGVSRSAGALRTASCLHCSTRPDRGGHRAITHTAVGAAVAGLVAANLCLWVGRTAALWVIGFAVWLAVHAALSSRTRARIGDMILPGRFRRLGKGAHRFAAMAGAVIVAGLAAAAANDTLPAAGLWWIGVAVGWGWLAHILGDACTMSKTPLFWPIRINGCRWHPIGPPWRFRTGGKIEALVVVPSMLLLGAVSLYVVIP
jgi:membrane-bound metal-dependent hydrolase YbcI (DUF457 family)